MPNLPALHPEGLNDYPLADGLYGDTGKPANARAEVCKLRKLLDAAAPDVT